MRLKLKTTRNSLPPSWAARLVAAVLLLAATTVFSSAAEGLRVETRLVNPTGPWGVGDPVEFAVILHYPRSVAAPPTLVKEFPAPVVLLDEKTGQRRETPTEVVEERRLRLAFFETGALSTGEIRYTAREQAQVLEGAAPAVAVTIQSVLKAEDKDPAPSEPPRVIPYPTLLTWVQILMGLITLALLIWMFRRWWRRRRGPQLEPAVPPDQEALQRLEALATQGLVKRGEHRRFYFLASEIVKDYLGKELQVLVLERTTTEILHQLPGLVCLSAETQAHIGTFLTAGDLVKFAGRKPDPTEAEAFLPAAVAIVKSVHAEHEKHQLAAEAAPPAPETAS